MSQKLLKPWLKICSVLILLFSASAFAEELNLYIEYCSGRMPSSCSEIKVPKAVLMLEKKGFEITDQYVTEKRIVIQLHDHCSYFEICPPDSYAEEAVIRLQVTQTYQTLFERVIKRHVFPRTSKVLLPEIIEAFNP